MTFASSSSTPRTALADSEYSVIRGYHQHALQLTEREKELVSLKSLFKFPESVMIFVKCANK